MSRRPTNSQTVSSSNAVIELAVQRAKIDHPDDELENDTSPLSMKPTKRLLIIVILENVNELPMSRSNPSFEVNESRKRIPIWNYRPCQRIRENRIRVRMRIYQSMMIGGGSSLWQRRNQRNRGNHRCLGRDRVMLLGICVISVGGGVTSPRWFARIKIRSVRGGIVYLAWK